ncbi:MAG: 6-bladed beta-propeller, partial [Bacteroidales bacterium]|nr:6-bladed beta-propeller [Bacteroidales bacterium]
MRTIIYTLIPLTLLLGAISCNQTPEPDKLPSVTFSKIDFFRMSDYFTSLDYLFLEPNPEGIFSAADKIILHKNRIFILDRNLKALFCYDTTGRFIYRIQRVGRGPGEYRSLDAAWLSRDSRELFLHCRIPEKTLVFRLDGSFIREFHGDRGACDRVGLSGGGSISYTLYPYGIHGDTVPQGAYISDPEGHYQKQVFGHGIYTPYWQLGYHRHFTCVQDTVYLLSQSDSIMKFDRDGKPFVDVLLNWGKYQFPVSYREIHWKSPRMKEFESFNGFNWKDYLLVTGPLRWFHCGKRDEYYYAIADVTKGTGHFTQSLVNDLGELPVPFPTDPGAPGELIGMLSMDLIWAMKEHLDQNPATGNHQPQRAAISRFIQKAIDADRPVLVRMKLRPEYRNNPDSVY